MKAGWEVLFERLMVKYLVKQRKDSWVRVRLRKDSILILLLSFAHIPHGKQGKQWSICQAYCIMNS